MMVVGGCIDTGVPLQRRYKRLQRNAQWENVYEDVNPLMRGKVSSRVLYKFEQLNGVMIKAINCFYNVGTKFNYLYIDSCVTENFLI